MLTDKINKRRAKNRPEVNMTSMIDIMSLLMIVFMATAPMLTSGIDVNLPRAANNALAGADKSVDISINKDGHVFVGKERVNERDLKPKLSAMLKQNPQLSIVISGDAGVRYGKIVEVMSDLKASGFTKVGLKTEPAIGVKGTK